MYAIYNYQQNRLVYHVRHRNESHLREGDRNSTKINFFSCCYSPETITDEDGLSFTDEIAIINNNNVMQSMDNRICLLQNNLFCIVFGAFVVAFILFGLFFFIQFWNNDWKFIKIFNINEDAL